MIKNDRQMGTPFIDYRDSKSNIEAIQGLVGGETAYSLEGQWGYYNYITGAWVWVTNAGGGAGVWGAITGILSDQTDLQTALDSKEDTSNKSTDVDADQASNSKYPSVKAVFDWAVGLFLKIGDFTATLVSTIQTAALKNPPADADSFPINDVAGGNVLKRVSMTVARSYMRTLFDTLYVALSGDQTVAGIKTFSSDPIIPDEAYDATAWNGSLEPPTKNAVRDKIESLSSGSTPAPSLCEARLSLSSTLAVLTSALTGQGTLYLHPYKGNRISLYNGSAWVEHTLSSAISFTLSGVATASTCYDVFVYDNSGTLTLDLVAWTNATTRATALVLQDGIEVKSGATGRKYVGTIYVDGSKQSSFDANSATVNSTTSLRRHVWNRYNKILSGAKKISTTAHTYNSATYRKWNNDNLMRHEVVTGLLEDVMIVVAGGNQHTGASMDVALNWSSGGGTLVDWYNNSTSAISAMTGGGIAFGTVGMSTVDVVEASPGAGTVNFNTCVLDISYPC